MSICCSYNNFLSSLCSVSNWNMIISLSSLHFFLMKTRFHNTYNPPALCHILGNPPYSIRRTEKKTNCAHDNKKIKTFFPSRISISGSGREKKRKKRDKPVTQTIFFFLPYLCMAHTFLLLRLNLTNLVYFFIIIFCSSAMEPANVVKRSFNCFCL